MVLCLYYGIFNWSNSRNNFFYLRLPVADLISAAFPPWNAVLTIGVATFPALRIPFAANNLAVGLLKPSSTAIASAAPLNPPPANPAAPATNGPATRFLFNAALRDLLRACSFEYSENIGTVSLAVPCTFPRRKSDIDLPTDFAKLRLGLSP